MADGATRMIAEVLVEALPQWIMQAVIMVLVSSHVRDGTASEVDKTLYSYQNGSFVQLMPKSILISSLTMLKTWYDLVQEVRAPPAPPPLVGSLNICLSLHRDPADVHGAGPR